MKHEGFTPEEKQSLVLQGLMDPAEIGLKSIEEAILKVLPEAEKPRKLGDFIVFEASEVPLNKRAEWARQELKIIPPDPQLWEDEWKAKHKDEIFLQGRIRCGNATAVIGGPALDRMLGLLNLMEDGVKLLRDEYDRERAANANP